MSRFRLEDYEGQYVMHVKTEEEYDAFSKFLDSKGEKWNNGDSYLECSYWGFYKNEICFEFDCGAYSTLGYYRSRDYTILEFSDFDWGKEEMKEFKVGDWVKGKEGSLFENKALQIVDIVNNNLVFANHEGCLKSYCAELVCEFTINQEVEISANGERYGRNYKEKFYGYDGSLEKPYLTVNEEGNIENWKYCRAIKHKYEPYTEFDPTWIGKDICCNGEFIWTIVGKHKDGEVVLYNDEDEYTEQTLSELIEYTWEETGKPCGKEIK